MPYPSCRAVGLLGAVALLTAGCGSTSDDQTQPAIDPDQSPEALPSTGVDAGLAGRWLLDRRTDDCEFEYPSLLEFRDEGLYAAEHHDFAILGGGDYAIDGTVLRLQDQRDRMTPFTFSLDSNALTLIDEQGCQLNYTRA